MRREKRFKHCQRQRTKLQNNVDRSFSQAMKYWQIAGIKAPIGFDRSCPLGLLFAETIRINRATGERAC